jgi:hypothetical protein
MSDNDLRTLMRDAVDGAPDREFSTPVIASAARARTRRRRAWYGVAGLGAAAAVAAAVSVGGGLAGGAVPAPSAPVAQPSAPMSPAPDPGAIGLPTSLPVGETVAVVEAALPTGIRLGELPLDAAWSAEGTIELPMVSGGGPATLTISATAAGCSAESSALDAAALDAVASTVCAAAAQYPSLPGTPVGGGSIDPAA